LRKACTEQISSLENVLITVSDSVQSCEDLQTNIGGMESLETEVIQKVERQFEQLKSVIDEKKADATNTIKHLESVKNYRPPATDFTSETLTSLQQFKQEIHDLLQKLKGMNTSANYLDVLKE
jgi:DNA repair exonuclease SbcCD ATPase subunit